MFPFFFALDLTENNEARDDAGALVDERVEISLAEQLFNVALSRGGAGGCGRTRGAGLGIGRSWGAARLRRSVVCASARSRGRNGGIHFVPIAVFCQAVFLSRAAGGRGLKALRDVH